MALLTAEEILETFSELSRRVKLLKHSPIDQLAEKLKTFDPRRTPPFDIHDIGRVIGKVETLKVLLSSLESDLSTSIAILRQRLYGEGER